jgi:hypothetical protein
MWIRNKTLVWNNTSTKRWDLTRARPRDFTVNDGKVIFRKKKSKVQVGVCIKFGFGFCTNKETFKGPLRISQRYIRTLTGSNVRKPFWKQQEGMINFRIPFKGFLIPPPPHHFVIFTRFSALISPRFFLVTIMNQSWGRLPCDVVTWTDFTRSASHHINYCMHCRRFLDSINQIPGIYVCIRCSRL